MKEVRYLLVLLGLVLLSGFAAADILPPVANFTVNTTAGPAPLSVSFYDNSTNSVAGRAWYFGDETYREPWINMTRSPGWSARQSHTMVVIPDEIGSIVLMGGWVGDTSDDVNDTWYSPDKGATWIRMTDKAQWPAREEFSSVALSDRSILLMGGWVDRNILSNDTWQSTDYGATWSPVEVWVPCGQNDPVKAASCCQGTLLS